MNLLDSESSTMNSNAIVAQGWDGVSRGQSILQDLWHGMLDQATPQDGMTAHIQGLIRGHQKRQGAEIKCPERMKFPSSTWDSQTCLHLSPSSRAFSGSAMAEDFRAKYSCCLVTLRGSYSTYVECLSQIRRRKKTQVDMFNEILQASAASVCEQRAWSMNIADSWRRKEQRGERSPMDIKVARRESCPVYCMEQALLSPIGVGSGKNRVAQALVYTRSLASDQQGK
ncbi:unnamed protein product [Caretta caretta]